MLSIPLARHHYLNWHKGDKRARRRRAAFSGFESAVVLDRKDRELEPAGAEKNEAGTIAVDS
jgi:hypothetical protein